ncbi:MAG: LacI family transcriptional regulator [Lachnospiraceae bacterium]|nr:LacI family transcriptional regulator [Lachnospiraceae bacterium]
MSTIRDVAALANVSAATVSRVLNHDTKYKMTDETIERVWKAVAELGYKAPTSTQKQMRYVHKPEDVSQTRHKFGCILNVQGGKYNDPYYLSILSGFEDAVMKKGYEISFIRTNEELEDPKVLYSTFRDPVSGVIIMNTLEPSTFRYLQKQTPYIVGIDTDHNDIDNVAYDHYNAAFMAIRHLMDKGYKRIGFIGGFQENMKTSRRYNGYYSALHCFDLEYNPDWVLASNWDEEHCDQVLRDAYKKGNLPDAFFVASDLMAISVLRTLFDLGVKVPEEVAVIGLSNIEISKYSNPPLTTIALPIRDMGRVAAGILFDRIEGDDTPSKIVTLSAEVLQRSST